MSSQSEGLNWCFGEGLLGLEPNRSGRSWHFMGLLAAASG